MSLNTIIDECVCDDPADTARAVLVAIGLADDLHDLLFPLVRGECIRRARYATRIAERVGIEGDEAVAEDGAPVDRAAFLSDTFYNGEVYVRWDLATVEDHLSRIRFQQSLQAGIAKDVERHRWAVEQITSHGVSCLAEIDGLVLA